MLSEAGHKELMKLQKSSDPNAQGQGTMAGCTATVALVTPTEVWCCNAGDSRTVISKNKIAQDLSRDHKPDDSDERRRIYNANCFIEDSRVNGRLALSRALGDFEYKSNTRVKPKDQAVTAFPEIRCVQISGDTEFLILACDGIWDVMTSQKAVSFIHTQCYRENFVAENRKRTKEDLINGVEAMLEECCAKDLN